MYLRKFIWILFGFSACQSIAYRSQTQQPTPRVRQKKDYCRIQQFNCSVKEIPEDEITWEQIVKLFEQSQYGTRNSKEVIERTKRPVSKPRKMSRRKKRRHSKRGPSSHASNTHPLQSKGKRVPKKEANKSNPFPTIGDLFQSNFDLNTLTNASDLPIKISPINLNDFKPEVIQPSTFRSTPILRRPDNVQPKDIQELLETARVLYFDNQVDAAYDFAMLAFELSQELDV